MTACATFGVSTHALAARDGSTYRHEVLVFLRDGEAALQICANIGAYLLDEHVGLLEGETMAMHLEADAALDRLVVAAPDPPYAHLGRCDELDEPVELVRLLPFAQSEHHVVIEHGWRELLRWLDEYGYDSYDLNRGTII